MDVTLTFKNNSFLYNISPLMPISYLRTLAHKSFKIPEYLVNLSYKDSNIEKQYNETSLKDYFKLPHVNVQVNELEPKNIITHSLTSFNISSSLKSSKMRKFIQEEENKKKKNFDINMSHSDKKKDKCQECQKKDIEYFCRENCRFLCKNCQKKHISRHKDLLIEKENYKQCGYYYQKKLIEEVNEEEEKVKKLIEKSSVERLNNIIENVYDQLEKINSQEREIMENFPCVSMNEIYKIDFNEMRRNIYSIKEKNNLSGHKDLLSINPFFKDLFKQDNNLESVKKDIESAERKYNFQDMLLEIIESIGNNLKQLHDSLSDIWYKNRYNVFEFSKQLVRVMKETKKNFKFNEFGPETDDEKTSSIESELQEIIFENKQGYKKKGEFILPKIGENLKNHSMFGKFIDGKNSLSNNVNIHQRKKVFSDIKINKLLNDYSSDSDSETSKSFQKEKKNYPIKSFNGKSNNLTERKNNNVNIRLIDRNSIHNFQLDQVLLTENYMNKSPKRPHRKSSVRMSIFTRNMRKFDLSTSKLLKVKKKKKKNF